MTPIDIQVRRSKVKVKGHASQLHLVQLITQKCFAPEALNLISRYIVLDEFMTRIDIQVSRSKVSVEGQAYSLYIGEGGHKCFTNSYFGL